MELFIKKGATITVANVYSQKATSFRKLIQSLLLLPRRLDLIQICFTSSCNVARVQKSQDLANTICHTPTKIPSFKSLPLYLPALYLTTCSVWLQRCLRPIRMKYRILVFLNTIPGVVPQYVVLLSVITCRVLFLCVLV